MRKTLTPRRVAAIASSLTLLTVYVACSARNSTTRTGRPMMNGTKSGLNLLEPTTQPATQPQRAPHGFSPIGSTKSAIMVSPGAADKAVGWLTLDPTEPKPPLRKFMGGSKSVRVIDSNLLDVNWSGIFNGTGPATRPILPPLEEDP